MNCILKFNRCWSVVQRNFSFGAQTERQLCRQAVNSKLEMIGVSVFKGIKDLKPITLYLCSSKSRLQDCFELVMRLCWLLIFSQVLFGPFLLFPPHKDTHLGSDSLKTFLMAEN